MIDRTTPQGRAHENRVLTILRRFIPGDYHCVGELYHPAMFKVGLDLSDSKVLDPVSGLLGQFCSPTISSRTPVMKEIIKMNGGWCFIIDKTIGGDSGASLFICQVAENPHQIIKSLERVSRGTEGFILVRPVLDTFLVAMQASTLKGIFKAHD